jgi:hypothetical protein
MDKPADEFKEKDEPMDEPEEEAEPADKPEQEVAAPEVAGQGPPPMAAPLRTRLACR